MLKLVRQLHNGGRWREILDLHLDDSAPAQDRAWLLMAQAVAHEKTATDAAGYRAALTHAAAAVTLTEPGSFPWVWGQHMVACFAADLGMYKQVEHAAICFLEAAGGHPHTAGVSAHVRASLGRSRAAQRRYGDAISLYREALTTAADPALRERIQLLLVWAYAKAGDTSAAFAECPSEVRHVSPALLHAAMAAVLAHAGDWAGAQQAAKAALPYYQNHAPLDVVEHAELAMILRRAAQALGNHTQAKFWRLHTSLCFFGWQEAFVSNLLPTLPQKGGEGYNEAADCAGYGPVGHDRMGLLGVLG